MRAGLALLLAASLSVKVAAAEERHLLVVTAVAPLDAERLADALRAYLDGFDVDLKTAPAVVVDDLRTQLGATRAAGEEVRAFATVRVAGADAHQVEIEVVDRLLEKSLIAAIDRPMSDADLYRTVALKVQALLRAALSEEAPQLAATAPALGRLAAPPAPSWRSVRIWIDAGYELILFGHGGRVAQGLSLAGRFEPRPLFEVALAVGVLSPVQVVIRPVTVEVQAIPVELSARLCRHRRRYELILGVVGQLRIDIASATGGTEPLRGGWFLAPGVGLEGGGRLRLSERVALTFAAAGLFHLDGEQLTVHGSPVFDASGFSASFTAGLTAGLW